MSNWSCIFVNKWFCVCVICLTENAISFFSIVFVECLHQIRIMYHLEKCLYKYRYVTMKPQWKGFELFFSDSNRNWVDAYKSAIWGSIRVIMGNLERFFFFIAHTLWCALFIFIVIWNQITKTYWVIQGWLMWDSTKLEKTPVGCKLTTMKKKTYLSLFKSVRAVSRICSKNWNRFSLVVMVSSWHLKVWLENVLCVPYIDDIISGEL